MTASADLTPDDLPHGVRLLHVVSAEEYPPAGGAFVWNGAGLKKLQWVANVNSDMLDDENVFLMLDNMPLLHWQMQNACPTCEQLLQVGDAPSELIEKSAAAINCLNNETPITDCLAPLSPIIHLLTVGLYFISFDDYSPTNGAGRFYWRAFGELHPCESMRERADCGNERLRENGNFPAFLAPTQSTAKFDQTRFDSARLTFREQPGLALYLHGRLSALLDGHHRATCAAMHGERFRALTISAARVDCIQEKCFLASHQASFPIEDVPSADRKFIAKLVENRSFGGWERKNLDVDAYHAKLQRVVWPELPKWVTNVINPANYWDNDKLDTLAWFSKRGVPVEQDLIEETLGGTVESPVNRWATIGLLESLFRVHDPRAVPTAIRVTQNPAWSLLWQTAYQLLSTIRSEEVENQFVQFLIDDDGSRPEIKAIVDRYFEARD